MLTRLRWLASAGLLLTGSVVGYADIVVNGLDARFVRVENVASPRTLQIGEVEAFSGGATLGPALNNAADWALTSKGATFHSEVGTGGHGLNTAPLNGIQDAGGATYTRDNAGSYTLNLGATRNLATIRVWQRQDTCCDSRLRNFTVTALADNGGGAPGAVVYSQNFPGTAPSGSFATFDLTQSRDIRPGGPGVIGVENVGSNDVRYIKVENLGGTRTLHIGELEAFQVGVTPAAGLDNANDVALLSKGASFEAEAGTGGHGANTGPLTGVRESGGATYTRDNAGFYLADLGQGYDLATVRLWQRGDACCDSRLNNVRVSLIGESGFGGPGATLATQDFPNQVPSGSPAVLNFGPIAEQFTLLGYDNVLIDIDPAAGTADLLNVGTGGAGTLVIDDGASLVLNFLNDDFQGEQTFNILEFASLVGSFNGNITINGLPDNVQLDLSNLEVNGEISTQAVPEPGSVAMWLLIAGVSMLAVRQTRRRK